MSGIYRRRKLIRLFEEERGLIGRCTQRCLHVEIQCTRPALQPHWGMTGWNFIFIASASRRLLIMSNEPSQFKRGIEQPLRGEAHRERSRDP